MIKFTEKTNLAVGDSILLKGKDQEGRRITIDLHCRDIQVGGLPCEGYVTIPAAEELKAR